MQYKIFSFHEHEYPDEGQVRKALMLAPAEIWNDRFDTLEEAETYLKENGKKYCNYTILPIYYEID